MAYQQRVHIRYFKVLYAVPSEYPFYAIDDTSFSCELTFPIRFNALDYAGTNSWANLTSCTLCPCSWALRLSCMVNVNLIVP